MCRSRWRKQIGMIDDHDECSGWMFLLVPAHPGCPGQFPQSHKTVVCVCVFLVLLFWCRLTQVVPDKIQDGHITVVCLCVLLTSELINHMWLLACSLSSLSCLESVSTMAFVCASCTCRLRSSFCSLSPSSAANDIALIRGNQSRFFSCTYNIRPIKTSGHSNLAKGCIANHCHTTTVAVTLCTHLQQSTVPMANEYKHSSGVMLQWAGTCPS